MPVPTMLRSLFGVSLICLSVIGCGEAPPQRVQVFPVEGQLTRDGQPLANAFVVLHPRGGDAGKIPPAQAQTDEQGKFRLTTYEKNDGAAAGDFDVTVQLYQLVEEGGSLVTGPNVLPAKFGSPTTTDIRVTVAPGQNQIKPIDLITR